MCCGRGRRIAGAPSPSPLRATAPAAATGVTFQYVGRTALTVTGTKTGRRYRFDGPGARLVVDARDREGLATVPVLRMLG